MSEAYPTRAVEKRADPKTEEMRIDQRAREEAERRRERESGTDDEAEQHKRRAQKSAYLKRKLEERARSERDD